MTKTPHPAVVARRRRLHKIRVRIATGAVGLFIAVFSVIYAQMPASAGVTTTAQKQVSTSSPSSSSTSSTSSTASSSASSSTPMTTSQS